MSVFVVVPGYNEEEKIGRVVSGLFENKYKNVVVVDDGSSDNTAVMALKHGAFVIRHEINRGQGAALQTGNEFALSKGARIIVHFDGDGQFNSKDIAGAVKVLEDNQADIVLGSRFLDNRSRIPWSKKYIFLPITRFFHNLFSGVRLTDVHNGFRVMTKHAAEQICVSQAGMAHGSEIISQIKKYNLRYKEYPVEVVYTEYGQGIASWLKILRDLITGKFIN